MTRIASIATALPPHVLPQAQALEAARQAYSGREDLQRLLRVFSNAGVDQRHFAFPPEYYLQGRGFEDRNRDFIEQAAVLAARAGQDCLQRSGVDPRQVGHFYLVTTTGLATPSLDALLVGRLGLRRDVRRNPLFGLGCAGGAGALTRAADLRGRALVISVELCGQVFSPRGGTATDVIGAALFGDGAAALLVDDQPGAPRVRAAKSVLFPGTEHLMGWSFTSDGMRLRLSKEVTDFIRTQLRPEVDSFLRESGVSAADIGFWALHPGGRKVLDTFHEAFGLDERALRWSRASLARVGNLSSASVLFILADIFASGLPRPGDKAFVCALGPGFASELLILEW